MPHLILLNKPYQVLCQFTSDDGRACLAQYCSIPNVYAAGRLDYDSEGLLILSDHGPWQHAIAHRDEKLCKEYTVQVDGAITEDAIEQLREGVQIKGGLTRPAQAEAITEPDWLWPRTPPVRYRAEIPTSWIRLIISEGRNRQVRKMCAAVGFPCLRLIRTAIGDWNINNLASGALQEVSETEKNTFAHTVKKKKASTYKRKPFHKCK